MVVKQESSASSSSPQEAMALRNARFAPLTGRPISDEGRAVVTKLNAAITAYESRTYARKGTRAQFDKAIGAFAADLLLAQGHSTAKGWIHRSLRDESFDNGPVTRTQARAVWRGLAGLGLIRHIKGYTRFEDGGNAKVKRHTSPKMCATAALLQLCAASGVKVGSAKLHFTGGPPKDPVIVRATATYDGSRKYRGKLLRPKIPPHLRDEVARDQYVP
jgi:hypothetical protein